MTDDKFDFNLPDLPSDEELGISEEDYDLLDEAGEIRPEPPPGAEAKASAGSAKASKSKKADKPPKNPRAKKPPKKPRAKRAKKDSGPSWFARRRAKKASLAAAKAAAGGLGADSAGGSGVVSAGGSGGFSAGGGDQSGAVGPEGSSAGGSGDGAVADAERVAAGPRYLGPVVLLLLVVTGWVSTMDRARPSPRPANAPAEEFSSARAMTDLVEIARLPHPTGSP